MSENTDRTTLSTTTMGQISVIRWADMGIRKYPLFDRALSRVDLKADFFILGVREIPGSNDLSLSCTECFAWNKTNYTQEYTISRKLYALELLGGLDIGVRLQKLLSNDAFLFKKLVLPVYTAAVLAYPVATVNQAMMDMGWDKMLKSVLGQTK